MRLFVFGLRARHVFVMVLCLIISDTISTIVFIINNIVSYSVSIGLALIFVVKTPVPHRVRLLVCNPLCVITTVCLSLSMRCDDNLLALSLKPLTHCHRSPCRPPDYPLLPVPYEHNSQH
jgi:hypothetical protein